MIRKSRAFPNRKSEIRGCCDLGSSYFRLLVVEGFFPDFDNPAAHRFEEISKLEEKRYIGWGEELAGTGVLGRDIILRAASFLEELVGIAVGYGCNSIAIVGTNTLREAKNSEQARKELETRIERPIRVISQREEASLGFIAASFFSGCRSRMAFLDMGGTSTELAWGEGMRMEDFLGLPIGTHKVQKAILAEAKSASSSSIARLMREFDRCGSLPGIGGYDLPQFSLPSRIVVTGGTATSVAMLNRMLHGLGPAFDGVESMTIEEIVNARRHVERVFEEGAEGTLPFDPNRTALLPAGTMLLESLLRKIGSDEFAVTTRDLRWGVLLESGR